MSDSKTKVLWLLTSDNKPTTKTEKTLKMPRSLRVDPQYLEETKSALLRNGFARQQDLAEALGISRDTVNKFLTGKPVGYLNFYEICNILGLSLQAIAADLLMRDGEIISSTDKSNLPHRSYSKLFGREQQIDELLQYISHKYRQHMTIVQGIGGVGKTSLVIEAASRCWEAREKAKDNSNIPIFDAIIFTSAKDTDLLPVGVVERPMKEPTLQDLFRTIARVLKDPAINKASDREKISAVYESLGNQRTLLIVDNMETIKGKDREDILAFLNNLPRTVQSIITTREQISLFSPISLKALSEGNSIQLIQKQAEIKNIELKEEHARKLYHRFGGVPLALIYVVGQLSGTYSLEELLNNSVALPEDVASFCFEESVKPLRNEPAHSLLMSMAMFRTKVLYIALANVAGLETEPIIMERSLEKLKQLSLVYQEEDKYKTLPITREYALSELAKFPSFEQEARKSWINYYIKFTQQYGGKDWEDWRVKYNILDEEWSNTLQVLDWCAANGLYENVIELWSSVSNYIDLKGDWDTLLNWWSWIEKQSKIHKEWSVHIDSLSAQAWILILKGGDYYKEVEAKINKAWAIQEENKAVFEAKAFLAIINSIFLKIEHQYEDSLQKLNQSARYLEKTNLKERNELRYRILITYHRAEIYNCEDYANYNTEQAKTLFYEVCQIGQEIGWSRYVNYAQNDLVNISILEGNYQAARIIIDRGLREAIISKENRRIGHWYTSLWRLEKQEGHFEEAMSAAKNAQEYFRRTYGEVQDLKDIEDWLKTL